MVSPVIFVATMKFRAILITSISIIVVAPKQINLLISYVHIEVNHLFYNMGTMHNYRFEL